MRITKPYNWDKALANFRVSDWKDIPGLINNIDDELKNFGLELVMADLGSDDYLVRVDRRRDARKKKVGNNTEHSSKISVQRRRVQRQACQKDIGYVQLPIRAGN